MNAASSEDWASIVAEGIVGDIPHAVFVRWAADVPARVAATLRLELSGRSSHREIDGFVEQVVRALPDYLPEPAAARLRAKLIGALLTAGALGEHLRAQPAAVPSHAATAAANSEAEP